jgi:polar amino acid transport system substrate-binding protein
MKTQSKFLASLLVLILPFLLLTGCSPAGPAKEDNVLTMGTNAEFAPFEFINEQNEIVGFDIDLANEIANHLGYELVIENMAFDGLIPALEAKRIDIVVAAMTITEERQLKVNFSDPYFNAGQVIVVRDDNTDITSIDNLKEDKKIAVQLGTTGDFKAQETTAKENILAFPQISLAFMELETGRADAVIVDKPVADRYLKVNEGLRIVGDTLTDEYFGIAVHKDNPELLNQINEALKAIKESGKYDELISKWFN